MRRRGGVAPTFGSVATGEAHLARGAQVDGKNLHGITPLHIAAEKGRLAFVELLARHGADLDETRAMGMTALHFALGIVSGHSFSSEHFPAPFSTDGTEVYWTQASRGPLSISRLENGRWTPPATAPKGELCILSSAEAQRTWDGRHRCPWTPLRTGLNSLSAPSSPPVAASSSSSGAGAYGGPGRTSSRPCGQGGRETCSRGAAYLAW